MRTELLSLKKRWKILSYMKEMRKGLGFSDPTFKDKKEDPLTGLNKKLNPKEPVPKMTYVSSEGTNKDEPVPKKEPQKDEEERPRYSWEELEKVSVRDFYIPVMGNPRVSSYEILDRVITPIGDSIGKSNQST